MKEPLFERTSCVLLIAVVFVSLAGGHTAHAGMVFSPGPTIPSLSAVPPDGGLSINDGPDITNQVLYEEGGRVMRMVGDAVVEVIDDESAIERVLIEALEADLSGPSGSMIDLFWNFDVEVEGDPLLELQIMAETADATDNNQAIVSFAPFSSTSHFEGSDLCALSGFLNGTASLTVSLAFLRFEKGDQITLSLPEEGGVWITAIPEPSSAVLLMLGGLALVSRRLRAMSTETHVQTPFIFN